MTDEDLIVLGAPAETQAAGGEDSHRKAKLGGLAGIEPFMTQNAPTLTTGRRTTASRWPTP